MAVIRDVMPAFELFQPARWTTRWRCSNKHGTNAWVLAGGLDSFDWLKDRIKRPEGGGRSEPGQGAARHSASRTAGSRSAP